MATWTYFSPHTRPSALDVVWCHFPLVENVQEPAIKARPALVNAVLVNPAEPTHFAVRVVYGTSKLRPRRYPDHLVISNATSKQNAGLFQATRFDLDRMVMLPWSAEWFAIRPGYQTPIVGHLDARTGEQLAALIRLRALRQEDRVTLATVQTPNAIGASKGEG